MIRRPGREAVALAVAITVATNVPVVLSSALIVDITREVRIPPWSLGVAIAAYWVLAAATSGWTGRIAHLIGERNLASLTLALAAVSLLGTGLLLPGWGALAAWLAVAGIANGFGHPSSNGLIHSAVAGARHGLAFGLKQGAVPLSGLIAGASLPFIALPLGWRAVYVLAAAVTVAVAIVHRITTRPDPAAVRPDRVRGFLAPALRRQLTVLACATGLAGGAAGGLIAFTVTGAVERGVEPGIAGLVLAAGSLFAVTTRLLVGASADAGRGGGLTMVAVMVVAGGAGAFAMALPFDATFFAGFVIATGIGWGWPGLVHYGVARKAGSATLAATGIMQTGTFVGGAVTPAVVGLLFGTPGGSYTIWLLIGGMFLTSAVLFAVVGRAWSTPVERVAVAS